MDYLWASFGLVHNASPSFWVLLISMKAQHHRDVDDGHETTLWVCGITVPDSRESSKSLVRWTRRLLKSRAISSSLYVTLLKPFLGIARPSIAPTMHALLTILSSMVGLLSGITIVNAVSGVSTFNDVSPVFDLLVSAEGGVQRNL